MMWDRAEGDGDSTVSSFRVSFSLFLAVVGSAILPIPYAFRVCGLVLGLVLSVAICVLNLYSSVVLIRAARYLDSGSSSRGGGDVGQQDLSMERLAEMVGGRTWRVAAQACLAVLLFGNLCGSMSVMKEVSTEAVSRNMANGAVRDYLIQHGGWRVLFILVLIVIMPLCLLRRMRQLEAIGSGGVVVLFILASYLTISSVSAGMPGLQRQEGWENPWIRISERTPISLGVLGFAFYLQPQLLPLLRELPPGPTGRKVLERATSLTLLLTLLLYCVVGFFSAAQYGPHTRGNILENVSGDFVDFIRLDAIVAIYLAVSYIPIQFSFRCTVEDIWVGSGAEFSLPRYILETFGAVFASFVVAAFAPKNGSAIIFSITGSTGVCLACYALPILMHIRLSDIQTGREDGRPRRLGGDLGVPLLTSKKQERILRDDTPSMNRSLPWIMLTFGILTSVLALWGSLMTLR